MSRVALVSSHEYIDEDPDIPITIHALEDIGIHARAVAWDDSSINWESFKLVVIRSCWDYPLRHEEFLAWARTVPNLANPFNVVKWNIDKRYMQILESRGVGIIPSRWDPSRIDDLTDSSEWVIKPTISASTKDTFRTTSGTEAIRLAGTLRAQGRSAIVQPYISEIESVGEVALVYVDGVRVHAIRKGPSLFLSSAEASRNVVEKTYEPADVSESIWQVADNVLKITENIVSPSEHLLYARIDIIPLLTFPPPVMEVELIEPTLFLSIQPSGTTTFVEAIARRVGS